MTCPRLPGRQHNLCAAWNRGGWAPARPEQPPRQLRRWQIPPTPHTAAAARPCPHLPTLPFAGHPLHQALCARLDHLPFCSCGGEGSAARPPPPQLHRHRLPRHEKGGCGGFGWGRKLRWRKLAGGSWGVRSVRSLVPFWLLLAPHRLASQFADLLPCASHLPRAPLCCRRVLASAARSAPTPTTCLSTGCTPPAAWMSCGCPPASPMSALRHWRAPPLKPSHRTPTPWASSCPTQVRRLSSPPLRRRAQFSAGLGCMPSAPRRAGALVLLAVVMIVPPAVPTVVPAVAAQQQAAMAAMGGPRGGGGMMRGGGRDSAPSSLAASASPFVPHGFRTSGGCSLPCCSRHCCRVTADVGHQRGAALPPACAAMPCRSRCAAISSRACRRALPLQRPRWQ